MSSRSPIVTPRAVLIELAQPAPVQKAAVEQQMPDEAPAQDRLGGCQDRSAYDDLVFGLRHKGPQQRPDHMILPDTQDTGFEGQRRRVGASGNGKVHAIHHPQARTKLAGAVGDQSLEHQPLVVLEVLRLGTGEALRDGFDSERMLPVGGVIETALNLQGIEPQLAEDLGRPKQGAPDLSQV